MKIFMHVLEIALQNFGATLFWLTLGYLGFLILLNILFANNETVILRWICLRKLPKYLTWVYIALVAFLILLKLPVLSGFLLTLVIPILGIGVSIAIIAGIAFLLFMAVIILLDLKNGKGFVFMNSFKKKS